MSIQTEIDRLALAKQDIKTAIQSKGVSVSDTTLLSDYGTFVESIQTPTNTVYSGTSNPTLTLGKDGDVYVKIS